MFMFFDTREDIAELAANAYITSMNALIGTGQIMSDVFRPTGGGDAVVSNVCDKVYKLCDKVSEAMAPVGLALCVLFLLIGLAQLVIQERFDLETFIKFFGKFGIAIFLVVSTPALLEIIRNFGAALSDMVTTINIDGFNGNTFTYDSAVKEQVKAEFLAENEGVGIIIVLLQACIDMIPISAISGILCVVTYVLAFSRIFEISIRGAFLPVAFGLIPDDGWRGAAGRYIRKYIAVCCQGMILVMISRVMTFAMSVAIKNSGGGNGEANMVIIIGVAIASIALMFKSIGFVNDIFGA